MAVGHIVADGAADLDGRIRSGDEIISVDGYTVLKASHRQVVQFMSAAASRGSVVLVLRRRLPPMSSNHGAITDYHPSPTHNPILPPHAQTYDVVVNRNENEGFGFVIISSVNKAGSTIGEYYI